MEARKILGLAGSVLLFLGVFMPIVSLPFVGSVNYFYNGRGDGVIILLLVAISIPLALFRRYHWLWTTGLTSLTIICYTFFTLQFGISKITTDLQTDLKDNPFRGLAGGLMQLVQLQWGWAVLIVGSALLIAAAALRSRATLRKCPHCDESIQPKAKVCRYCNRDVEPEEASAPLFNHYLGLNPTPRMPLRVKVVTGLMIIGIPLLAFLLSWMQLIIALSEG